MSNQYKMKALSSDASVVGYTKFAQYVLAEIALLIPASISRVSSSNKQSCSNLAIELYEFGRVNSKLKT